MRTSRFENAGRHRKQRDTGFAVVQVVAAGAVAAGVVAGGLVVANNLDEADRVQVADLTSSANADATQNAPALKVAPSPIAGTPATADGPPAPEAESSLQFVATAEPTLNPNPPAVCSTRKGAVSLKVDALVHALGAKGGTVRSEAAEANVLARPAKGNACTRNVTLYMGQNHAFVGRVPYGNWVLDVSLSGAKTSTKLTVNKAKVSVPTQLLDGDCGGTASVTVRTATLDSLLGSTVALPAATVTAVRVPDSECAIPAESTFVTGAGGTFTGSLGYGDWMFSTTTALGKVSEFVVVGKDNDEIVLAAVAALLD